MALVGILAAGAVLFERGLRVPPSFDEGVYLAQTDALSHGQQLGTVVFAAQPPGFYWLLQTAAWIGGLSVDSIRIAVLVLALIGIAFVYAVGRFAAGPPAGLIAAAALTISPSYRVFAAQVSADLPGTVLALGSLACVLAPWSRLRLPRLLLGGILLALAELVKLDAFIVVLPAVLYLALRRLPPRDLAVAAGAAVGTFAVATLALGGSLAAVWRGAVSYHVAARAVAGGASENFHQLASFFHPRQPFTALLALALLAAIVNRPARALWPFWIAALAAAVFILWHRPLHDNHIVLLAVAASTAAGLSLGAAMPSINRWATSALIVLAVLLAAGYVQDTRQMARNAAPIPAGLSWAARKVAASTPAGSLVVSDEPLVPFLAHRQMLGQTIDTALLRFAAGYLDDGMVIRAAADPRVRAVVAGRAFLTRPRLLATLSRRFAQVASIDGVSVYLRRRRSG